MVCSNKVFRRFVHTTPEIFRAELFNKNNFGVGDELIAADFVNHEEVPNLRVSQFSATQSTLRSSLDWLM